jgi:DNA ligase-1
MYDAEAVVVGYQPGEGKFSNMMGALICEDAQGRQFKVGTGFSDAQRSNPPPIGSRITYRYQELTENGAPRFPAFVTIRDYE